MLTKSNVRTARVRFQYINTEIVYAVEHACPAGLELEMCSNLRTARHSGDCILNLPLHDGHTLSFRSYFSKCTVLPLGPHLIVGLNRQCYKSKCAYVGHRASLTQFDRSAAHSGRSWALPRVEKMCSPPFYKSQGRLRCVQYLHTYNYRKKNAHRT